MNEYVETELTDEEYNKLWEIAGTPRNKMVEIPKSLLNKLLTDQVTMIQTLEGVGFLVKVK